MNQETMEQAVTAPGLIAARLERSSADRSALRFGRHVVVPGTRTVLLEGAPVFIGSRAFDLLVILLECRGKVVEKHELMRHVWPTTTVDESNLRFQMTTLRKALGAEGRLLKTIPGRGYFVAAEVEVTSTSELPAQSEPPATTGPDQAALKAALCEILRVLRRCPDALSEIEELLSVAPAPHAQERVETSVPH